LFSWTDDLGKGFDPGVFGRFDLAALAQPHLKISFVCLFILMEQSKAWKVLQVRMADERALFYYTHP
jgi:hypothetical protein